MAHLPDSNLNIMSNLNIYQERTESQDTKSSWSHRITDQILHVGFPYLRDFLFTFKEQQEKVPAQSRSLY